MVFANGPLHAFGGLVAIDAFGAYVLVLRSWSWPGSRSPGRPTYLAHEAHAGVLRAHDAGRYYALLLWFVAGLAAVPLVDNLGLVWVGIEATTIVSALLVGFSRTPQAIEAAWKYLILGSIGIGFALLGTLLVYASSVGVLGETSDALDWTRLVAIAPRLDPAFVRLAFIFALAGYGTKAGLAPFHTWLPDAHSQAPSPISALLSGGALAVSLYALARFHLVAVGSAGAGLLLDAARRLRPPQPRGGAAVHRRPGGPQAAAGLLLDRAPGPGRARPRVRRPARAARASPSTSACHGLAKSTAFLAAGRLVAERGSRRIGRLGGSLARSPVDGRALVVAALLLAGLPPSGIFVAELAILFGGFRAGWGLAAAAAALILALAARRARCSTSCGSRSGADRRRSPACPPGARPQVGRTGAPAVGPARRGRARGPVDPVAARRRTRPGRGGSRRRRWLSRLP